MDGATMMTFYKMKLSSKARARIAKLAEHYKQVFPIYGVKEEFNTLFEAVELEVTSDNLRATIEDGTAFLVLTSTSFSDLWTLYSKGFTPLLVRRKDFYVLRRMMCD